MANDDRLRKEAEFRGKVTALLDTIDKEISDLRRHDEKLYERIGKLETKVAVNAVVVSLVISVVMSVLTTIVAFAIKSGMSGG